MEKLANNVQLLSRLPAARLALTHYMIREAHEQARHIGFGYIDRDDAPDTFEKLQKAYDHSQRTGLALPVWSGGCENTIYTNREGNLAFRYLHDCTHVQYDLQFTFQSEIEVALLMGLKIKLHFGKDSLEYKLYLADTIGQSIYAETHNGEFPENQMQYVLSVLKDY